MKKITLMLILAALLLSGCANKDTDEKKETKKETTSSVDTQKKEEKKTENKEEKTESKTETAPVTDSAGNTVTSENLAEMIEKANAEDTDEATKREILDEIDYILKQAEKNAQ